MYRPYTAPRIVSAWPLSAAQIAHLRSDRVEALATAISLELRLVELLRRLFVGRDDAFLDERGKCIKQRLARAVVRDHLRGRRRIGAYSLLTRDDGVFAKFLAFDVDGKNLPGGREEALALANAVAQVLEDLGLPAYLEQSRSGQGFHVWVFYGSNAVPLDRTQHLGRLVLGLAGLAPETEVFPKGTPADPYGATLYMPMHNFLSTSRGGTLFVRPDGMPHDDQLQWLADVQCVTAMQVAGAIHEAERRLQELPPGAKEPNRSNGTKVNTARILQGVPEGQRDKELFRLACRLRHADVPQEAAERLVADAAANCTPPFPTTVALGKVKRAYARYASGERDAEGWAPPTPFHTLNLPEFPVDALTPWLGEFVAAEAIATQTPPDLAGGLGLGVAAAAVARKVEVRVKNEWVEPLNIYTATAQRPGTRKSAVFSHLVRPLEEFERREAERLKPAIEEAKTRRSIALKRLARAQKAAAEAAPGERVGLEQDAVQAARELSEIDVPLGPKLIVDDCSPERLATLLRDHGGRMAVMSPEGDVFDLMAGRYSGNGEPNFGVYLKGHAGDTLRVDRVSRPTEYVPHPALTMGLTVQPFVLRGLANRPGFRGRGLLGRILYAVPKDMLGDRDVDPPSVPTEIRARYDRNVQRLLDLSPPDDSRDGQPHHLQLSPDAWATLKTHLKKLEPMLSEHAELGTLTDWAGKLGGAAVRLAGILHMAEHVGKDKPWEILITQATMGRAIRLGDYYLAHARAAFAEMGADPEVEAARHVLVWIQRHEIQRFSRRDAFEGTKGRFKRVKELDPSIELLVEHGFIRVAHTEPRPGPGRRPSPVYEVNPYVGPEYQLESETAGELNSANSANSARDKLESSEGREGQDDAPNTANSAHVDLVAHSEVSLPSGGDGGLDRIHLNRECPSQNSQYSHNSPLAAPSGPCRACRTVAWWSTPAGDWVCGNCHPRV